MVGKEKTGANKSTFMAHDDSQKRHHREKNKTIFAAVNLF